ncbi:hypothetical protein BC828DRAFT_406853 [Blastocladiella britannica]|nr:hypothetical protein BC828DRAFT_406853 [Blastocladiella britannica]
MGNGQSAPSPPLPPQPQRVPLGGIDTVPVEPRPNRNAAATAGPTAPQNDKTRSDQKQQQHCQPNDTETWLKDILGDASSTATIYDTLSAMQSGIELHHYHKQRSYDIPSPPSRATPPQHQPSKRPSHSTTTHAPVAVGSDAIKEEEPAQKLKQPQRRVNAPTAAVATPVQQQQQQQVPTEKIDGAVVAQKHHVKASNFNLEKFRMVNTNVVATDAVVGSGSGGAADLNLLTQTSDPGVAAAATAAKTLAPTASTAAVVLADEDEALMDEILGSLAQN